MLASAPASTRGALICGDADDLPGTARFCRRIPRLGPIHLRRQQASSAISRRWCVDPLTPAVGTYELTAVHPMRSCGGRPATDVRRFSSTDQAAAVPMPSSPSLRNRRGTATPSLAHRAGTACNYHLSPAPVLPSSSISSLCPT
jgi:hypothetical protein